MSFTWFQTMNSCILLILRVLKEVAHVTRYLASPWLEIQVLFLFILICFFRSFNHLIKMFGLKSAKNNCRLAFIMGVALTLSLILLFVLLCLFCCRLLFWYTPYSESNDFWIKTTYSLNVEELLGWDWRKKISLKTNNLKLTKTLY